MDPNDDEIVLSFGEGVEREVIHAAFQSYLQDAARWFTARADGHSTLATTYSMSSAQSLSAGRRRDLLVLGALTALSLVHGIAPCPLDPVLLHFIVHKCNLHSILPGFLGEWHPELRRTLLDWIEGGPTGDITAFEAHFITYHDLQVRYE
jgi:hypothetical protein